MSTRTYPLAATDETAAWLLALARPYSTIVTLEGNLGAGKTTLVQALCRQLGYNGSASSPTFSLVNEYPTSVGTIYHLDLYRLTHPEQLQDLALDELLDSGSWVFIEWPQLAQPWLAQWPHVQARLTADGPDARTLAVELA